MSSTGFCGGPNLNDRTMPTASAIRRFVEDPTYGNFIDVGIWSYDTEAEAAAALAVTEQQASSCTEYTSTTESGETLVRTISPLSFPRLGDETLALREGITQDAGFDAVHDVVFVQEGQLTIGVSIIGLSADVGLLETLSRASVDRVRRQGL
jgi:hypothetical protein